MSPPGGPPLYRVVYPATVRAQTSRLLRRARAAGIESVVAAAVRTINDRLRTDPLTFGEARYHLAAMRLAVRVAICRPLVVHYAVHEEKPLVFVQRILKLAGQ